MKRLKDLKQRRATLATEMRSLNDSVAEGTEWTGEQRGKWDTMKTEIRALDESIEREELLRESEQRFVEDSQEERSQRQTREQGTQTPDELRSSAFLNLLRNGLENLSPEERSAVAELRAQGSGNTQGGYTVPTTLLNRVLEAQKAFGGIEGVSQIITTDSGSEIAWPTSDGASDEGELVGENTDAGEKDIAFGIDQMGAHKLTSKIIRIPLELLQDSGLDLEGYVAQRIATRIGRARAKLLVRGTGVGTPLQPKGLKTAASVGATTAAAGKVVFKDVNALIHSIDPAYRSAAQFRIAFNDKTLQNLEDLEDGQGRPIWLPGVDAGAPATILKYKYVIDQAIDDIAADTKFMYAGDFNQFVIRNVRAIVIRRLVERYAEFDQVGFLAFQRFGCVLQDTSAIKALAGKAA
jgi:HK97 family phage major capsid protein